MSLAHIESQYAASREGDILAIQGPNQVVLGSDIEAGQMDVPFGNNYKSISKCHLEVTMSASIEGRISCRYR